MSKGIVIRKATVEDISQIQIVRHSVKENILSDPALVSDADCERYLTERGRGWVCESDDKIVAFGIVDLVDHNVWALFAMPEFAEQGIGKRIQNSMLDWYFKQTRETLWLGTAPNTRAETFYSKTGWKNAGFVNKGEVKFEMSFENWNECQKKW